MTGKRPRTVSVSLSERGQTTQDFAVGIGLFLLAMAFVFSYVPTLVTPFSTPVGGAETAQADRIAATIVDTYSESDRSNHLIVDDLNDLERDSSEDLIAEFGLRSTQVEATGDSVAIDRINVTMYPVNDSETYVWTAGDPYDDTQATSSASRIVTVDAEDECKPACRLTVRVW